MTILLAALVGCHPQEPFYLKNVDPDLKHYMAAATQIEDPAVDADRLPDVSEAHFALLAGASRHAQCLGDHAGRGHADCSDQQQGDAEHRRAGSGPARLPHAQPGSRPDDLRSRNRREQSAYGHGGGAVGVRRPIADQFDVGEGRRSAKRQCRLCRHLPQRESGRSGDVPGTVAENGGHRRNIRLDAQRRLRQGQPAQPTVLLGLEREARGRTAAAVDARRRRAVQPHRRPRRDARHVQRRRARADSHRHRLDRLRDERAESRPRRGGGLLGAVFPIPRLRRGDFRARQRLGDVAESLHALPHRQRRRRSRKTGPGHRAILSLPQHGRAVAQ